LRVTIVDLIQDWAKYDAAKESSERLADDWRFCTAFYKGLRQEKEIFVTYDGKKKQLTMYMLLDMAIEIVKERLKRGFKFHPEDMKPMSEELYNQVMERLPKKWQGDEDDIKRVLEGGLDPEDLSTMSDDDLLELRKIIHEDWKKRGSKKTDEGSIDLNLMINHEIERRGLKIPDQDKLDEVTKKFEHTAMRLQDRPQAKDAREKEMLAMAGNLEDIVLDPDHVSFSGGSVYGMPGRNPLDLDCIVKEASFPERYRLKLTRMIQAAQAKVFEEQRGICYHEDEEGPNWRYLPAYDLVLRKKKIMAFRDLDEPGFEKACYMQEEDVKAEALRMAQLSMKEDKVVPMRFCHAMKPTKPDYGERRQSVETFMEFFKEKDFPVLVSKKYDGLNMEAHKRGDKIRIWTEQGQDITSKVPNVVEAFKKLSGDFVLLAELELWKGEKHLPREAAAGQINRKVPDDSGIVANVYTIVYMDKDIHKLPESERQEYLGKLKLPQATVGVPDVGKRLNTVPNITARNMAELKRAVSMLSMKVGSEGVVVKKASAQYYLDGNSRNGWVKYHLTSVLSVIVIEAIETKVGGKFNYRYGLEPGGLSIARKNLE